MGHPHAVLYKIGELLIVYGNTVPGRVSRGQRFCPPYSPGKMSAAERMANAAQGSSVEQIGFKRLNVTSFLDMEGSTFFAVQGDLGSTMSEIDEPSS